MTFVFGCDYGFKINANPIALTVHGQTSESQERDKSKVFTGGVKEYNVVP